ncbi:peptidyl-tRNA hydrolase [Scheffersomyces coipomensis]|uniref:peptidyl-tRNA hydrolase n=1 Tax=Scheffersomyces coipomensis TaxID=1788519 RepID=UPI00315D0900
MDKRLILFSVGNPGPSNRHSTGHLMLKELVSYFDVKQLQKKSPLYSITSNDDHSLILVKSNSYMNDSGKAFKKFIESERINLASTENLILILYDDFENKIGNVKLSTFKNHESHNGIKSIQTSLTQANNNNNGVVFNLGIGIGPKPNNASRDTMASWVLSDFKLEEKQIIETVGLDVLTTYLGEIIEVNGDIKDCNKFNAHMAKMLKGN